MDSQYETTPAVGPGMIPKPRRPVEPIAPIGDAATDLVAALLRTIPRQRDR